MTTYRSKPTTIEAVQWTGSNWEEVVEFLKPEGETGPAEAEMRAGSGRGMVLKLLAGKGGAQGFVPVPQGHWIVRQPGDLTDHWPVDPDYFAAKYEPA